MPFGLSVNEPRDAWWHASTTGLLLSDPLHAGDHMAASDRLMSLMNVDWRPERFHTPPPAHWKPTSDAATFMLRLTCPIENDRRSLLSDQEANDAARVEGGAWLYRNAYEGSHSPSVVAPLRCWEIIGIGVMGTGTVLPSPWPISRSLELARGVNEYTRAMRAWDDWANAELEEDDEEEWW